MAPRSQDSGSQDVVARVTANRQVSIAGSKLPPNMLVPETSTDPITSHVPAPYRTVFSPQETELGLVQSPERPGSGARVLERPQGFYLNESVGRDRMRQAAQEQEFPVQPFLTDVVKYTPQPGAERSAMPSLPPQGKPDPPGKSPPIMPSLPNASVNGPMSPFGVAHANAAKNLPREVSDAAKPLENVAEDPFYPMMQQAMDLHRDQIRVLVQENEELKDKLNAVLIASWHIQSDDVTGKLPRGIMPLHLTTEVPDYLRDSWLWTVTEEDHAKQFTKSDAAFPLLTGWVAWNEMSEEALKILKGEDEMTTAIMRLKRVGSTSTGFLSDMTRESCLDCAIQSPDSTQRLVWDLCGVFLLMYDVIMIPIGAFDPEENGFLTFMDWTTLLFWTLDMAASFLTGYIDKGVTIMHPGRIAANYLSSWFWVDALVVVPDWAFTILEHSGSSASGGQLAGLLRTLRAIRVVRLLRLAKLRRFIHMVKDMITSETVFLIVFVLQLLTLLLFCNHFLGSVWYLIGDVAKDGGDRNNWITKAGIQHESVFLRYLTAYQWSMSNFALGSSSVVPRNSSERSFSVTVLIFGMVTFSMMTASITSSMVRLQNINSESENQFWLLRRYLRQYRVPSTLTFGVLRYLEYKTSATRDLIQEDRLTILSMLPESLHRQLKCEVNYGPLLSGHPLFVKASLISQLSVHALADSVLGTRHLADEDTAFTRSTMASHMFWMVGGSLRYKRFVSDIRSEKVDVGDWICEGALWTWWATRGDLISSAESLLITVEAKSFVEELRNNEMMLALMSSYAEHYLEWLNKQGPSELSDVSFAAKGGLHPVKKFVEHIPRRIRDREEEEARNKEKTERKRAERLAREAGRTVT